MEGAYCISFRRNDDSGAEVPFGWAADRSPQAVDYENWQLALPIGPHPGQDAVV